MSVDAAGQMDWSEKRRELANAKAASMDFARFWLRLRRMETGLVLDSKQRNALDAFAKRIEPIL